MELYASYTVLMRNSDFVTLSDLRLGCKEAVALGALEASIDGTAVTVMEGTLLAIKLGSRYNVTDIRT